MNIEQANNLDMPDLLSRLGHRPDAKKSGKGKLWYRSPFRPNEKDPSFQVRRGRDYPFVFKDFGSGQGNTVIDFICAYKNLSKKDALAFLDGLYPNFKPLIQRKIDPNQESFPFSPQAGAFSENSPSSSSLQFIEALPLRSQTIFEYLRGRGISGKLAAKHLKLVKYRNIEKQGKEFYGFGMQNIHGYWEVRSASDTIKFKAALGQKGITVIEGREQGRGAVSVFEGMTDFLSLCMYFNADSLKGTGIILNGLELFNEAAAYIEKNDYQTISLFLDNNEAGTSKTESFIERFGQKATDYSYAYAPHTDLNDALVAKYPLDFTPPS